VTLFKEKYQIWILAILIRRGYRGRVNGVTLGCGFQHPKSSWIDPIFGTCMYVSIYYYFAPGFRVSVARITQFLYSEYQHCAFLNCSYQKGHVNTFLWVFLATRSHIVTPREGLAIFFDFFELVMLDLGAASHEISRSLRKIQMIHSKVCAMKREQICVSQVVYYLYGVLCATFYLQFR
jgi:hypothetical protein